MGQPEEFCGVPISRTLVGPWDNQLSSRVQLCTHRLDLNLSSYQSTTWTGEVDKIVDEDGEELEGGDLALVVAALHQVAHQPIHHLAWRWVKTFRQEPLRHVTSAFKFNFIGIRSKSEIIHLRVLKTMLSIRIRRLLVSYIGSREVKFPII